MLVTSKSQIHDEAPVDASVKTISMLGVPKASGVIVKSATGLG